MIDTFASRLKKWFYFQIHYCNLVALRETLLKKPRKVLILDERIKAIKFVESGKSSRKVAEE